MICMNCPNRTSCKTLCQEIETLLENKKLKNGIYAETTELSTNVRVDPDILDRILYVSPAFSEEEGARVRHLVVAILTPEQKRLLGFVSEGLSQEEIANLLNITQSGVSQRLRAIKNEVRKQFHKVIDYIIV